MYVERGWVGVRCGGVRCVEVEWEVRGLLCLHLLLAFIDIYFGYFENGKKEEEGSVGGV